MQGTVHAESHFTSSESVRDIVIGMSDGLTVPFALAAGLSGAVNSTGVIVIAGLAEIAAGSIAMGLGGYLAARNPRADGTFAWRVEQGFEMGRPSILDVEADKRAGKVTATRVGGTTVPVCEGTMTL